MSPFLHHRKEMVQNSTMHFKPFLGWRIATTSKKRGMNLANHAWGMGTPAAGIHGGGFGFFIDVTTSSLYTIGYPSSHQKTNPGSSIDTRLNIHKGFVDCFHKEFSNWVVSRNVTCFFYNSWLIFNRHFHNLFSTSNLFHPFCLNLFSKYRKRPPQTYPL